MKLNTNNEIERIILKSEVNSEVLSFVELHIIPDILGKKPVAHIHKVFTDESHREQGLASNLLSKAVDRAKSYGCYKVFLTCSDDKVPFYVQNGFVKNNNEMVKFL